MPFEPTVLAARAGDPDAFAALYDAHAPRVFALCVRMAGDRAAAAELMQDVFVRVWEQLGSFRGESSFTTWLTSFAPDGCSGRCYDDRLSRRAAIRRLS